MKYFLLIWFFPLFVLAADKKISELPLGSGASVQVGDSFPYVDSVTFTTKRLTIFDLISVPAFTSAFQSTTLASGTIPVGNASNSAVARTISGDGTISNTGVLSVTTVGGSSASSVNTAAVSVAAATASPTVSTLVARDGSGNFSAVTITAALTGNASTSTAFAADPTDCSADQAATAIAANGNLTCTPILTNPMSVAGDLIYGGTSGSPTRLAGAAGVLVNSGSVPSWAAHAPTVQRLTTGTAATYTTPAGVKYLRIRMVGGGGGGGGGGETSTGGAGGNGGATTFRVSGGGAIILNCDGGTGGPRTAGAVQAGGGATVNSPAIAIVRNQGGTTPAGSSSSAGATPAGSGGTGAVSPFGGAGAGAVPGEAGSGAIANTGSGGGGGSAFSTATAYFGGRGGASGGYLEAIIPSPSATYEYTIGAQGASGSAGTGGLAGGVGSTGIIIVEEYYH